LGTATMTGGRSTNIRLKLTSDTDIESPYKSLSNGVRS
jgi:hypothetical protein